MHELKPSQIRYLRVRAQRLIPAVYQKPLGPGDLLGRLCAVQAQDLPAANLAFRPRSGHLTLAEVQRARVSDGFIVRTWCMRGTLHMLAAEDLGWLLPLFGPLFVAKSRRRYRELALDEVFCTKAIETIPAILAGRSPKTRQQLAAELTQEGFPTTGQATYHLLRRAALEGVICYGPDLDGQPAFMLLDEWVASNENPLDREAALAQLARRYLAAYGPAKAEDLAAWSGLSIKDSRAGLAQITDDLLELASATSFYWILKSQAQWLDDSPPGPIVHLLPSFDTYLLGYRGRDLSVAPKYAKRIHPGGGVLRRTLLVDGWAKGTWHMKRYKRGTVVSVTPFEDLSAEVMRALEEDVRDLGRFLQEDITLRLEAPAM